MDVQKKTCDNETQKIKIEGIAVEVIDFLVDKQLNLKEAKAVLNKAELHVFQIGNDFKDKIMLSKASPPEGAGLR